MGDDLESAPSGLSPAQRAGDLEARAREREREQARHRRRRRRRALAAFALGVAPAALPVALAEHRLAAFTGPALAGLIGAAAALRLGGHPLIAMVAYVATVHLVLLALWPVPPFADGVLAVGDIFPLAVALLAAAGLAIGWTAAGNDD